MVKAGNPGATWTWTSTGRTSMPSNATVDTRWTISAPMLHATVVEMRTCVKNNS